MNRHIRGLVGLLGRSPAWQSEQKRFLNIHEYQGAELMASYGINVPRGIAVTQLDEVAAAASQLAGDEVVIKSQILAGGRGLGTFKSGFQGGVHLVPKNKAVEVAGKMLGGTLVTKQTGPSGRPVNTLLIAEKMNLKRETYFSIVLDRKTAGPMMIACAEGGTSIEDLAATSPEKIIRIPVDIRAGIRDEDAMKAVEGLQVTTDKKAAADQIKRLYNLFVATDATMLEVNPLAETSDGLLAADAKLGFDDSAEFRQRDLFAMADESQQDPREREAAAADLNFIALDGSIGCLVNGMWRFAALNCVPFGKIPLCSPRQLARSPAHPMDPSFFNSRRRPGHGDHGHHPGQGGLAGQLLRRGWQRVRRPDRRCLLNPVQGREGESHPGEHFRRHHAV